MSFPGSVLLSGADILKITSAKIHPLGTRGYTRDGRVYRYARNGGTALKAGFVVQSATPSAYEILYTTGTTELFANSTKVKVKSGTGARLTTKNSYADGFVYLQTSSTLKGSGLYAQIKSHTTETLSATGVATVYFYSGDGLYSPTTNCGSTNASLGIIPNPYDKVIVKPAGKKTALVVGVPNRPVTANYYFWVQTWGPCPIKGSDTTDVGTAVGASTAATAGTVGGVTDTGKTSGAAGLVWSVVRDCLGDSIGHAMVAGSAGKCRMVFLKLAP